MERRRGRGCGLWGVGCFVWVCRCGVCRCGRKKLCACACAWTGPATVLLVPLCAGGAMRMLQVPP